MATDKLVDFDHVTDYISREAEIQFFNDWVDDLDKQINDSVNYPHLRSDYKVCKTQLLDCVHAIEKMPSADVRPVVHGEWENAHPSSPMFDGGGPPYCSVCGKEAPLRSVEVNQWKLERGILSGPEVVYKTKCFLSNFCPNCGADMRESNLDTTKGNNHD